MGLDVYVGSLTRYYSGEWETIVQRISRENNLKFQTIRQHDPEGSIKDPNIIRPVVLQWRESLSAGLDDNISSPLEWDESPVAPYFTDKPTWDCYASLLLWAAYSEHADMQTPEACIEKWDEDEAFNRSTAQDFRTDYPSLLRNTEVWLPSPFGFSFTAANVSGKSMTFASAYSLKDELIALNERTWKASASTISNWRHGGASHLSPVEVGAKFASAVFHELVHAAMNNNLVMLLDY